MKSRRQMCRCSIRAPSFGYVGVRVLLPFPFHGRFYDSRRTLLSPPFLMFSDYQKSVEMKAPKSRPDHRRNVVPLQDLRKSFAAPELRMNLHGVVKLKPALQLSLMLCQKAMGVCRARRSLRLAFARSVGSASWRLDNARKGTRRRAREHVWYGAHFAARHQSFPMLLLGVQHFNSDYRITLPPVSPSL